MLTLEYMRWPLTVSSILDGSVGLINHCKEKWAASWQNQQNGMCTLRRLRLAGRMPKLIWVFSGRTSHFVVFVVRRLKSSFSLFRPQHNQPTNFGGDCCISFDVAWRVYARFWHHLGQSIFICRFTGNVWKCCCREGGKKNKMTKPLSRANKSCKPVKTFIFSKHSKWNFANV